MQGNTPPSGTPPTGPPQIGSSAVPSAPIIAPSPELQEKYSKATRHLYDQVLNAFDKPIKRVRVSPFYQLGLLITALTMMLLPLVYFAIIGVTGFLVYWHVVTNFIWYEEINSAVGMVLFFIIYGGPIIVGVGTILFMIKPIFARYPLQMSSIELIPEDEPLLFAFVEKLCKTVHAPIPREIHVNCDVNASARFRRGFFSMIRRDLVLTIGLPLVEGLNTRELAGVIAHEFGHFSQGLGLRISITIRSINMWFARVVYERDTWDEKLQQRSRDAEGSEALIYLATRLSVFLTRLVLRILMYFGHFISCYMSRQMEYDADKYEIRLAGSEAFESAMHKMYMFESANNVLQEDLYRFWKEGRLCDNLGDMIIGVYEEFTPELKEKIRDHVKKSKVSIFSTHPASKDRIKRANRQNEEGVFRLEMPSKTLFTNYEQSARLTSILFYRAVLGTAIDPNSLVDAGQLTVDRKQKNEEQKALLRYFQNVLSGDNLLRMPPGDIDPSPNPRENVQVIMSARETMMRIAYPMRESVKRLREANRAMGRAIIAQTLIRARVPINHHEFGLAQPTKQCAQQLQFDAEKEMNQITAELELFNEASLERLMSTLQLLHDRNVRIRMNDESITVENMRHIFYGLRRMSEGIGTVVQLRKAFLAAQIMLRVYNSNADNEDLIYALQRKIKDCYNPLRSLYFTFKEEPYPFDQSDEDRRPRSIAQYMIGQMPVGEVSPQTLESSDRAIESFFDLYFRLLGRLTMIAEKIELTIGMKALPEPEDDDFEEEQD